ncbi:MAG TPA: tRNA (N6-threonylcarbamoyladenosine(37)-N6)-methyltransferase TrmO [Victivallales bacterium]|nr:tRNA (N6-threonylcarbamoyladenosine(37)-N6)-methyltransferase TrmO [Victivallales bacterium]HRR05937.1 tRNA (N6-threonylcarbamoyladenosine(37)-N6)-methyltransferase TrmO [Victivallales bacterium]HRR27764.1 tRNA (N6-threonylcarbamoyladenosine(37)-N6)-methyltransferase TrmO [Victivallales bacterium]
MFIFKQIGIIRSPHIEADNTPIQPVYAEKFSAEIEIFPDFVEGLKDIEGFSHIYLLYFFHRVISFKLIVKPFLEDVEHGIFATRASLRPNPIGMSIVRLIKRNGNILHVCGADMLNDTPLLDIKPYIEFFDKIDATKNGWMDRIDKEKAKKIGSRNRE